MDARFDRLFVVTYGRSGSTLLQGLLNAIPGYRIYGENGGFLTRLHEAHAALADAHRHLSDPSKDTGLNAWYGSSRYREEELAMQFRAFAEGLLFRPCDEPEVRVFGFKEIRYGDLDAEALGRFLDFTRALWPRSAFVFNSRNLDNVVTSGWWRNNDPGAVRARLSRFDAFADAYAGAHPDHAIHLFYDRLVEPDRSEAARLLAFLEEAPPPEAVEAVFAQSHSWANRTLTEYLLGRADHVKLFEHDWWRANVEEFRLEVERRPGANLARGVWLPAAGAAARLVVRTKAGDFDVVAEGPTPRLGKLFPGNPHSAASGFRLQLASFDEAALLAVTEGGGERLVGRLTVAR